MKNIFLFVISVSILSLGLYNCTGKKQFEKGNYSAAVYKSIDKLRKRPQNKKARKVLKQAYPLAISYIKEQIDITKKSNDSFKWNTIVNYMVSANNIADEISRCPAARKIIPSPTRYDNELPDAKEKAAEECYIAGNKELEKNTRESAREAYFLFKKADNLISGYKDTEKLIPESKDLATLIVVLEQIPVGAGRLEISAAFFQNNVQSYINDLFERKEFVVLYLPEEAAKYKIKPDHIIRIQFDDFVVGNTIIKEKTQTVTSKDSVSVGTHTNSDGSKETVYNTVSADFTQYTKTLISKGLVDVRIIEFHTKKVLMQDKMPGEFIWETTWGRFNGDDRALSSYQIKLTKQREVPPPDPQDLFVEFTKPIHNQITSKLSSFYSRY
ncbi:MAG: hypothetical protein ACOCWB_06660 [Bacteroidota bacterium]